MTINECRRHCRQYPHQYSFLSRGNTCSCGDLLPKDLLEDNKCQIQCSGDSDQVCGALDKVSVYDGKYAVSKQWRDHSWSGGLVSFLWCSMSPDQYLAAWVTLG